MKFQLSYLKILNDNAIKVLHSMCQQIWKTQQWPEDWKKSVVIPIPKKGNAKECSNYHTNALISHVSKVLLKILQARLCQYVELITSRCTRWVSKRQRNQRSNFQHSLDHGASKGILKKNLLYFTDHIKVSDCVDHNKLESS